MSDIKDLSLEFYSPIEIQPFDRETARAIGSSLKENRERRRISLRQVCNETRIGIRNLQSIENGDFQNLPQGVYLRSFVRKYARCVEIETEVESYLERLYESVHLQAAARAAVRQPKIIQLRLSSTPPKIAEYVLYLFLSKAERVYFIGDLNEEYIEVQNKFGSRSAKVWFYKQVLDSLTPLFWRSFSRIRFIVSMIEMCERLCRK